MQFEGTATTVAILAECGEDEGNLCLIKCDARNVREASADTCSYLNVGVKLLIVKRSNHKNYCQYGCTLIALYEVTCFRIETTSSDKA